MYSPGENTALSVLVMLVSQNVFPLVSDLQSIAFVHIFFWPIRSLVDPAIRRPFFSAGKKKTPDRRLNVYRMRSLAVYYNSHSFEKGTPFGGAYPYRPL